MGNVNVPIREKYTLTIEEAAQYFRIGENKLRKLRDAISVLNISVRNAKTPKNIIVIH